MLKNRLLWQISGILGLMIFVGALVFATLATSQMEREHRANITALLSAEAQILGELIIPILVGETPLTTLPLERLSSAIEHRFTIIATDGRVLADNWKLSDTMDNHGARPEIIAANRDAFGIAERFSTTLEENMLYVALRLERDGAPIGFLRIAVPLAEVDEQLAQLRWQAFLVSVFVGSLFLVPGFLLVRQVTRPITEMTRVAGAIAEGHYELRLPVRRDGEVGELSRVLNKLASGAEERIDELTRSRNQIEAVLGGVMEGVGAVDLQRTVLHINDSARLMLGLDKTPAPGRRIQQLDDYPVLKALLDRCLGESEAAEDMLSIAEQMLKVSVVPLYGEHNKLVIGAIIVMQDFTERMRYEEMRRDFVANASHELKTPIAAIRGFVETILDDPDMPPTTLSQFLTRTRKQVERLNNIVQDLIDLSRFDSGGGGTLVKQPVELNALIQASFEDKADDAVRARIVFSKRLNARPVYVSGDVDGLRQMISNLLDNAIKYSEADGRVEISLELDQDTGGALIRVTDSGMGIPREDQQRIFERFYRVDRARSRDAGGTGLGLSIVKHICQAHDGTVELTSRIDHGSTFTVTLPTLPEHQ